MLSPIHIEDYSYDLPEERIAKYPVDPRDSSKLLLFKDNEIRKSKFKIIGDHLPESAHLVFNNTKVIPARLFFQKETGAVIEIFLLNPVSYGGEITRNMEALDSTVWHCMIGNKKRWKDHSLNYQLQIDDHEIEVTAELIDREQNHIRLSWDGNLTFAKVVTAFGKIPLPPYLNRDTEERDLQDYQTVYSEKEGAVAAPTAGLHFTDAVLNDLRKKHIDLSYITLHVGAGTFQPVKAENALDHDMHSEQVVFQKSFIDHLIKNHETVIPVGTTSMRSLESLYWFGVKLIKEENQVFQIPKLYPYQWENEKLPDLTESLLAIAQYMEASSIDFITGATEIFIFPGYTFRVCKGIITNFHQPKSTLLMLISALIGDKWKDIYAFAMQNDFRFLSYGDSSLLLP